MWDVAFNAIGITGAILILTAYFLLQADKIRSNQLSYQLLNFFGSLGLLASLVWDWNLASFFIEICWLMISIYGLYKVLIAKQA